MIVLLLFNFTTNISLLIYSIIIYSELLFAGDQNKLGLDESTTRQAMQLFKETKNILKSSMSSLGGGSVRLHFYISGLICAAPIQFPDHDVLKPVFLLPIGFMFSRRRSRGSGLPVFFTVCQGSAERGGRRKMVAFHSVRS